MTQLDNLRALGEPRIHEWAGASEPIGAGLVEWTRLAIAHDQALAVQASLAACALVTAGYRDGGVAPRAYVERMVAAIERWIADPSRDHRDAVRGTLDVHREAHAWQVDDDPQFWILEAVDHAGLTVWAGERASYIIPVDFATTAGRVIACVFHAMRSSGRSEPEAANAVIDVVLKITG